MKKTLNRYFALLCAALILAASLSGISLALTGDDGPDFTIRRLDAVTIGDQVANAKEIDEPEALYADDDEVIFIAELNSGAVMDSYGTVTTRDAGRSLTSKGSEINKKLLREQDLFIEKVNSLSDTDIEVRFHFTLTINAVSFTAPYGMYGRIAEMPEVKSVSIAPELYVPQTSFDTDSMYPEMYSAGDMVNLSQVWSLGYDGAGTLISVIDSGLYCEHEAFSTAPDNPKFSKADVQKMLDEGDLQAEKLMESVGGTITADDVYYNGKVIYKFDYNGKDFDVGHGRYQDSMDHGTHVAGIAAGVPISEMNGKEGLYCRGMAPEAQIAVMKVFNDHASGAPWDIIIAGIEDSIYIGADVINLSLGSPSGFPLQEEQYAEIYDVLDEYGISVMAAAGNDTSSAYASTWNTDFPTTEHPDSGVVDSPSTYADSMSVAAIYNNYKYSTEYLRVGDNIITFADSAKSQGGRADLLINVALGAQTVEIVKVPGYGTDEDYAGVDVAGKAVLVSRGNGTFASKMVNAYNHGAIAMIVYDNVVNTYLTNMTITEPTIPAAFISNADGLKIIACIEAGDNKLFVATGNADTAAVALSGNGGVPASFSAWGPLCTLAIKPEISAPGGNIMSAVDPALTGAGQLYGAMSGTSMSTPAVAGAAAIVRQYVNEHFPNKTPKEKVELINTLLMCTATPLRDADGVEYSVRKQGAGMINMPAAVGTQAYITTDSNIRPKLELGEDPQRAGVYTLNFDVYNFGSAPMTYKIEPVMQTGGYEWIDQGYRATYVSVLESTQLTDKMAYTTNYDNNTVTVGAGETKHITVRMTIDASVHELLNEVYPNGAFIEGYCYLRSVADAEGAVYPDLSICYLSYYGSWSEVPVVDSSYYYDDYDKQLGMMEYPNLLGARYRTTYLEAGMNPYFDGTETDGVTDNFTFLKDRITVSPANGDRRYDGMDYMFTGIMRNLKSFYYTVYDKETGEILWERVTEGEITKNLVTEADHKIYPMGYAINKMNVWKAENQPEGSTAMIRCGGVPYMDNFDASVAKSAYWEVPVTLDNTAPSVVESWSAGDTLYVTVTDNHYAAYAGVFENATDKEPVSRFCIAENERGAQTVIVIDMTGRESAYLLLGDYGCNEAQFEITRDESHSGNLNTYFELTDSIVPNSDYIIVSDDSLVSQGSHKDYALTSTPAQPGNVRLQGIRVTADGNRIDGDKYAGMIWNISDDGKIKNAQSGEYLGIVSRDGSYWLGTTQAPDTSWTYSGGTMTHDSSLTNDKMLVYAETMPSFGAQFDITGDSQAAGKIRLYQRVAVSKVGSTELWLEAESAGDGLVDVRTYMKTDRSVTNGIISLIYDSSLMSIESMQKGKALENGSAQFNAEVDCRVAVAFNDDSGLTGTELELFSMRFKMNCTDETIVAFDLFCSELYSGSNKLDSDTEGTIYGGYAAEDPAQSAVALSSEAKFGDDAGTVMYYVSISENSRVSSGKYIIYYNSLALEFVKHKAGDGMGDAIVMCNSSVDGELTIAFAGTEELPEEGGVLSAVTFKVKDGMSNYGTVSFSVNPVELLADDTVTVIPAGGSSCDIVLGTEPAPTPTPTSQPTAAPTSQPTAAPTEPVNPPENPGTGAQSVPYVAIIMAVCGMAGIAYFMKSREAM